MFSVLHPAPSVCIDLDLVDNDGHVFCMGKLPADLSGDNEPANPLPDPCPLSSPDLPCQRLPGEPRARALEFRAGKILQQALGPTKADLVQLFRMLPPQFVRTTASGTHVVGGASPRHRMQCTSSTQELPFFTRAVTRYLAHQHVSHVYTTFVIRAGCHHEVHRGARNGPTKALIQQLTPSAVGEGLWIQDVAGEVTKQFKGNDIRGTVVSLESPFVFDSRRLLHAGHSSQAHGRVIILAFSTIHASTLPWWVKEYLTELGFRLPTPQQIAEVTHGSLQCTPPRLKQLTLTEALMLPAPQLDQHDVVEILD